MPVHRSKNLNKPELDELEQYVDHRLYLKPYKRILNWIFAPGWWLIDSAALTGFYLIIIRPPLRHWVEIPAIFGAGLATLIITYSIGDMFLSRIGRI